MMTPERQAAREADLVLLRQVAELLYGPSWQTPLSRAMGINRRTCTAWAAGDNSPQPRQWKVISELVEQRQAELSKIARSLRSKS